MKKQRKIKLLVIHCSDTQDSLDVGVKDIDSWHKGQGWLGKSGISCGYHYVIKRDGTVQVGRPEWDTGAHTKGYNRGSIGICWVGRNHMTSEQKNALMTLCNNLMEKHELTVEQVMGHKEFPPYAKTCPNIDMLKFRADLLFHSVTHIDVLEILKKYNED